MLRAWRHPSLLWKILLSTSIAITLLLVLTGWFVQDQMLAAMSQTVESEMRVSSQAYEALWRSRAELLRSVSLVLSSMSDVRAAFRTQDAATIRDTAGEMWAKVSRASGIFLVTDPQGGVIASLGGAQATGDSVIAVKQAARRFPLQTSGFVIQNGRLFQMVVTPVYVDTGRGPGLLNVLVAGFQVDAKVAAELKEETGQSDFMFVAGDRLMASTLPAGVGEQLSSLNSAAQGLRRVHVGRNDYAVIGSDLHDILGQPIGRLLVVRPFDAVRRSVAHLETNLILTWIGAILAGLGLSYLLARRVLDPVKQLDKAAAQIARENYDTRVAQTGNDELARLAGTFNAMCQSIQEARQELIRRERISTIGHLSSSIVHDLRNPLAAIYGGSELLMDGQWNESQMRRLAANIYRSSRAMKDMLQELVEVSRGRIQPAEECSLRDVIGVALDAHQAAADTQGVALQVTVPGELELPLERARMERVFLNLLGNALEAMPEGGAVRISVASVDGAVMVNVADDGPGIPPEIRASLFQPFSTSGKKNGLGLGLALSRQTVLDHGGDMWIEDGVALGTSFWIRLPRPA